MYEIEYWLDDLLLRGEIVQLLKTKGDVCELFS